VSENVVPLRSPNRIRNLRNAASLSQEQVADALGCSKMHISKLERGGTRLTIHWMCLIAGALNVKPADLLNDEDNPYRLNCEEEALIARYRAASDMQKLQITRIAEILIPYGHTQAQSERALLLACGVDGE
jgi:transcriptional regulator with XRE-family HTH domain